MTEPNHTPRKPAESGAASLRIVTAADGVRAAAAASADSLAASSRATSTRRAYASGWAQFEAWCEEAGLRALPADPETVRLHLAAAASAGLSASTLRVRRSAIAHHHNEHRFPDPTSHPDVREVLAGKEREDARVGRGPKQAQAATRSKLQTMVLTTLDDTETWRDAVHARRDVAILTLGYGGGGLRRSELAKLAINDLSLTTDTPDGSALLQVRLKGSKTVQDAVTEKWVRRGARDARWCPWCALHRWLALCAAYDLAPNPDAAAVAVRVLLHREKGHDLGEHRCYAPWPTRGRSGQPLLRRLDHGGLPRPEPLSGEAISDVLARRSVQAGFEAMSGHSLRAGVTTSLFDDGVAAADVMAVTGHRSLQSVLRYDRKRNMRGGYQDLGL